MSSHDPSKESSKMQIPTEQQLQIVAERFKRPNTWGLYSSELKRFAKIMGLELLDFHGSIKPIFKSVPGREKENVFLFDRRPVHRAGFKKTDPLILSGEEIIKLAKEFRSVDSESNFLNQLLEKNALIKTKQFDGYLSNVDNDLGWGISDFYAKHDLPTLKQKLQAAGIPNEGMRIAKGSDGRERLYIGRSSLQHLMESLLPKEKKSQLESRSSSPPRGDSKRLSEAEVSEPKHKRDTPPGGLSLDEPDKPKDSGSPRSRSSRKK